MTIVPAKLIEDIPMIVSTEQTSEANNKMKDNPLSDNKKTKADNLQLPQTPNGSVLQDSDSTPHLKLQNNLDLEEARQFDFENDYENVLKRQNLLHDLLNTPENQKSYSDQNSSKNSSSLVPGQRMIVDEQNSSTTTPSSANAAANNSTSNLFNMRNSSVEHLFIETQNLKPQKPATPIIQHPSGIHTRSSSSGEFLRTQIEELKKIPTSEDDVMVEDSSADTKASKDTGLSIIKDLIKNQSCSASSGQESLHRAVIEPEQPTATLKEKAKSVSGTQIMGAFADKERSKGHRSVKSASSGKNQPTEEIFDVEKSTSPTKIEKNLERKHSKHHSHHNKRINVSWSFRGQHKSTLPAFTCATAEEEDADDMTVVESIFNSVSDYRIISPENTTPITPYKSPTTTTTTTNPSNPAPLNHADSFLIAASDASRLNSMNSPIKCTSLFERQNHIAKKHKEKMSYFRPRHLLEEEEESVDPDLERSLFDPETFRKTFVAGPPSPVYATAQQKTLTKKSPKGLRGFDSFPDFRTYVTKDLPELQLHPKTVDDFLGKKNSERVSSSNSDQSPLTPDSPTIETTSTSMIHVVSDEEFNVIENEEAVNINMLNIRAKLFDCSFEN